jgi:transposase, IS30 family
MGKSYEQLTLEERIEIYRLHAGGKSLRQIGALLGRSAGTISRELKRNSAVTKVWEGGYEPARAHGLTERRRARGRAHKLARQPVLQEHVRQHLAMGWSPEQIAGKLALERGCQVISYESIYRFVYHRSAQKDYWHKLLPQAKSRRGKPGMRGGSPAHIIKERVSIHQRPASVQNRHIPGHWEADLMLFGKCREAILVAHERTSRCLRLIRQPTREARVTIDLLKAMLSPLPEPLRQSVTFDNGTEFAYHYQLKNMNISTFFCDPHKPWQKGGVENAIRRMRKQLPRKTNIAQTQPEQIHAFMQAYNDTPRKCLGFLTPNEVFDKALISVALQT